MKAICAGCGSLRQVNTAEWTIKAPPGGTLYNREQNSDHTFPSISVHTGFYVFFWKAQELDKYKNVSFLRLMLQNYVLKSVLLSQISGIYINWRVN